MHQKESSHEGVNLAAKIKSFLSSKIIAKDRLKLRILLIHDFFILLQKY